MKTVGQAVLIAVADAANVRRLEGPDGVHQALLVEGAQDLFGLFLPQYLETMGVVGVLAQDARQVHADAEAIAGFAASGQAAADAGQAHDGVLHVHNLLHVLDGHHLAPVIGLLLTDSHAADEAVDHGVISDCIQPCHRLASLRL